LLTIFDIILLTVIWDFSITLGKKGEEPLFTYFLYNPICMDEKCNYTDGVIIDGSVCEIMHLRTTQYKPGKECRIIKEIKTSFYKTDTETVLWSFPIFSQAGLGHIIKKSENVTDGK